MVETKKLWLNNKVTQSPGLIVSNMGGEKVMLSIVNGKYYNLGEMGGLIWSKLEKPIKVSKLIDDLTSEYEVDLQKCEKDVIAFLNSLVHEDIIQVIEH